MKPPRAILETVIYASDLGAAETFYRDIFGLEVAISLPGQFVFFRCGEQMLLIFDPSQSRPPDPENPIPRHGSDGEGHFCFCAESRDDVDAWREHFIAKGIAIEHYHQWPNGSCSVYIRDPAGNSVEVAEARLWAQ